MANKKEKKSDSAVMIWAFTAIVVVFLLSFFMFRNIGIYDYEGLKFIKEKFGKISVYHYYYLYNDETGQLVQNNIYLRTNPERNHVPIEGKIVFPKGKFVYVSINGTYLENCAEQSGIALSTLSSFITNAGLNVKGATLANTTESNMNNATIPYITCENKPNNPVIEIQNGDKSQIINENLCYRIYISKCEDVLPATEKFIMQSIVDAK